MAKHITYYVDPSPEALYNQPFVDPELDEEASLVNLLRLTRAHIEAALISDCRPPDIKVAVRSMAPPAVNPVLHGFDPEDEEMIRKSVVAGATVAMAMPVEWIEWKEEVEE